MRNYQALYLALKRTLRDAQLDAQANCCTSKAADDVFRAQGWWGALNDLYSRMDDLENLESEGKLSDSGEILDREERST